MTSTHQGGCQCGAVRYQIETDTLISYACHCTECQKQSASGFGISVPVFEDRFELFGTLEKWTRPTASGSLTDCYFCPTCGSRVYHSGRNRPGLITVKGGSLDNPDAVPLIAHIWVASKRGDLSLGDGLAQWPEQPSSDEEWSQFFGGKGPL